MKRKQAISILLSVCLTLGALGILGTWWLFQPVDTNNSAPQTFVIPAGASVTKIANSLKDARLIRSSELFRIYVWKTGMKNRIQAGTFTLTPNQSLTEIALALTKGTSDVWITITEGLRGEEIGEQLEQALPNFDTKSPEFQTACMANEGRLFPETYLVPKQYNTTQVCQLLRREFETQLATLQPDVDQQEKAKGLSEFDFVTIASLVEREAKTQTDRKKVAGVLFNRLEIGMALQIDATLQYAKGYDAKNKTWWSPPASIDKNIVSPYNTYKNVGLPPTPISNPSLDSLAAVAKPTPSDYLYYLTAPDGTTYFAETYEEHQINIAKYLR